MYNYCLNTGTGLYLPQKWRAVIIIKQWVRRKTISRFRVPWEFLRKRVRGGLLRKLLPFPLCPFAPFTIFSSSTLPFFFPLISFLTLRSNFDPVFDQSTPWPPLETKTSMLNWSVFILTHLNFLSLTSYIIVLWWDSLLGLS